MNEVLIRRLVGASVLVLAAFAVASLLPATHRAVAPESGPDAGSGPRQVVRYDLQTGAPVGLKLEPKLQSSRTAPPAPVEPKPEVPEVSVVATAPATTAPPPVTAGVIEKDSRSAGVIEKDSRSPALALGAAPALAPGAADSTRGEWSVQVGSFADPANANGVRDRLKAEKLPASLQEVKVGRALWYRVRVGPFRDEAAAKRALASVQRLDFRGARIVSD